MDKKMKTIGQKIGVKEGKKVLVLNAPTEYKDVEGAASVQEADIIQIFISSKDELKVFIEKNVSDLKKSIALWVTYPKASPQLGINRDIIAQFLTEYGLEGIAICSVNEIWTAIRFKIR